MTDSITLGNMITLAGVIISTAALYLNMRKQRADADATSETSRHRLAEETKRSSTELKEELKNQAKGMREEFAKHADGLDDRIFKIETRIVDFMPRGEIEAKFDHEKSNRVAVQAAAVRGFERVDAAVGDLKVSVGRLVERGDGVAHAMIELKALVKEQHAETGRRIDTVRDAVQQSKG